MKCAFVGISNWALDPAKMNRGILVQRGTPESDELAHIAREICQHPDDTEYNDVKPLIDHLTAGYLEICEKQKPDERKLTEFYGLRDFYSLMKMVVNFARTDGPLNRNQLEHSIRRNFGGFNPEDTKDFDPMAIFKSHITIENLPLPPANRPPVDPIGLIKSSLSGEDTALKGMESRYLLILTENLSVLSPILAEFASHDQQPEVVFGSRFKDDVTYTQICLNINKIKTCMAIGKPVILLNLDDLYESLYDALNQYFSTWGDKKFVNLGLGTDRVKAYVHNNFRLVVVAHKEKVHKQFPIPLLNRLEKHYMSATTLLNEKARPVKKELEKWASSFVSPSDAKLSGSICPLKCHSCGSTLNKPYKLPCHQHYIGPCCTAQVTTNARCPLCETAINADFKWVVDAEALKNRQYFDNCSRETAFVGYSTDATALAVQKAIGEMKGDVNSDELLERAKFHLLQCATGEAVLRLNKTELFREARKIQDRYLLEQYHETLLKYLLKQLPGCGQPLYIQATTFADEMNSDDVNDFRAEINKLSDFDVELLHVDLKDFTRESQFTDAISAFYRKQFSTQCSNQCKLLLVQSDSANENGELLDSVRYIINREGRSTNERDRTLTHTVLLLNLPRGQPFTAYQGGTWQCVHIDDRRCAELQLPPLDKCLHCTPSQIIEMLIKDIKGPKSKDDDQPPPLEDEEEEDYPDTEYIPEAPESDSFPSLGSWVLVDNMLKFIIRCLPAALSIIVTDHQYSQQSDTPEQETLLKELSSSLSEDQDFQLPFLKHVSKLLKEGESEETHWVTSDAVNACNMKQSETLRHALEDSLERALVPALAAVISFIDARENLHLMKLGLPLRSLWIQIFTNCDEMGLCFEKLRMLSNRSRARSGKLLLKDRLKLPDSYKVQQNEWKRLIRDKKNNCKFPFSWLIKEEISNLAAASEKPEYEVLVDQFKQTTVGRIVMSYGDGGVGQQMFDAYITDFVYMSHPCTCEAEHFIVEESIRRHLRDRVEQSSGSSWDMVHIHLAFKYLQPVVENLSNIAALFAVVDDLQLLQASFQKKDSRYVRSDVLALNQLICALSNVSMHDILNDPRLWVEKVNSCEWVASNILSYNETNEESDDQNLAECRNLWLALVFKKLVVEHIIIPTPAGHANQTAVEFAQRKPSEQIREWTFKHVIEHINVAMNRGLHALYGNTCPKCGTPLANSDHFPTCNCDKNFLKDIKSDLLHLPMDGTVVEEFKALRKRWIAFLMSFLSEIIFDRVNADSKYFIEWFLDRILPHDTSKALDCLLFSPDLDLDLSHQNVLSPYILKVLLKLNLNTVDDYLDGLLSQPGTNQKLHLQTILLLMNCYMDMYVTKIPQDVTKLCQALTSRVAAISHPVPIANVRLLRDAAEVQVLITHIVEQVWSLHPNSETSLMEATISDFIQDLGEAGILQPRYLIARQLLATRGESFIKDVINSPHDSLIRDDVKQSLDSFTAPIIDRSRCYRKAKRDLTDSLAPKASAEVVESFLQNYHDKADVLAQVAFTAIVCRPDVEGGKDFLVDLCELLENQRQQYNKTSPFWTLLKLFRDRMLPEAIDVKSPGNRCAKMSLGLLLINMYSCLNRKSKPHLGSLNEIFHQPSDEPSDKRDQWKLLPTMSDEPDHLLRHAIELHCRSGASVEGLKYSRCVKGHVIFHDQDIETWLCEESGCGTYICHSDTYKPAMSSALGGESKPGHILGSHETRSSAQPVRELNSLSCAVLRCITHLCMFTASLFHRPQVYKMIQPFLAKDSDVQPFLEGHIQVDIQNISECCGRSTDDCILLVHDVIHRMQESLDSNGEAQFKLEDVNSEIERRRRWECLFDSFYIKPTFNNQVERLRDLKDAISWSANETGVKGLLSTDKPINDTNILASPGLWEYRRPLTMSALRSQLNSTEQTCPHLRRAVDYSEMLIAMRWLPDILSLIHLLNDKFHSKLSRTEASKVSIAELLQQNAGDTPILRGLVDNFLSAWNKVFRHNADVSTEFAELDNKSAVSKFLIDQRNRSPAYVLVKLLTDVHNSMLTTLASSRPILLSAITQLNIVCIQGEDEILSLVAAHSEYELKEANCTTISYNWSAIDNQILQRYISNKPKIHFSDEQLPCYVFEEDFNLHNQMQAISDSQEQLSTDLQHNLVNKLGSSVQCLTSYLKELKVVINFLSVMTHIKRDNSLAEYVETTFGREPDYLSKDIQLKHVKHVWLIVKYTQTDLLMRENHQESFDDIDGECREDLTKEQMKEVDTSCMFNSQETNLLLHHLFDYIILKLNKDSLSQEALTQEALPKDIFFDISLRNALNQFHPFTATSDQSCWQQMPESLKVKHAAKAWSYIWKCYTIQRDVDD